MNLTAETALHNGKYVLDTPMGQGVFDITYRATHTESGQTVVIKTLDENLHQHSDFDQFKQQFRELAKRLSHCKHPNLLQVLDYFEDAERPYLVMEYIPGQTLAELIQSDVLSEAKAIHYIRQIGNALSVLHKAGLVHRAVKPQNIIRRQDTHCVVLCEFGITCEFTAGVMQTHASLISAGYAPLEQYSFESQRIPATDIYALAATLYCLLTGRPPLPAPVRQALHSKGGVSATAPSEPRLFPQNLPPGTQKLSSVVKQAIGRGLAVAAQRRPQTVEAWLSLLPSKKPSPKPQSALTQNLITQPKAQNSAQAELKPSPTKSPTLPPTPEKIPTPKPALTQNLVTKVKTQNSEGADVKPSPTTSPMLHPPIPEQKPTPQLAFEQNLLTKLKTQNGHTGTVIKKLKIQNGYTGTVIKKLKGPKVLEALAKWCVAQRGFSKAESSGSAQQVNGVCRAWSKGKELPLRALLITGAIAASAGVGFGFALRTNAPNQPGSTLLHTEQSFPPSSNWPMSRPQL